MSHMMSNLPVIFFLVIAAVAFLSIVSGLTYTVFYFRDINRNPDKYRQCADTLPCGDRVPTR